jgi:hypothetical protein
MRMRPERSAADSGIGSRGHAGTASSARPRRLALSGFMPVGTANRSTLAQEEQWRVSVRSCACEPLDCEKISMAVASYALGRRSYLLKFNKHHSHRPRPPGIRCTLNDIKTWRPEPQAKAGLRPAFMKRFPRALPR